VELKEPLAKDILENDLVCLTATKNNNINLESCYIEIPDDSDTDDDDDDDDEPRKRHKRKGHHHRRTQKHTRNNVSKDDDDTDDKKKPENKTETETRQIEVPVPVQIHEGRGLVIRRSFKLNLDEFRPTTRQQRQCWSWYRKQWKKVRYSKSSTKNHVSNLIVVLKNVSINLYSNNMTIQQIIN